LKIFKWAIISFCVFCILYYTKSVFRIEPAANTPEYLERHGLIPGAAVEISLDGVIIAIPKEYEVNVKTFGDIKKGHADSLAILFEFQKYKSFIDSSLASDFKVRVELRKFNGEAAPTLEPNDQWQSSIIHKELGLIEYHSKNIPSGWGSIVFSPVDSSIVGPSNERLEFRCSGNHEKAFEQCWLSTRYTNNINAWIFIPASLLPFWHDVYNHINSRLHSFMME